MTTTAARLERAFTGNSEAMTRFCPGCGSVGEVPDTYIDCCPDGMGARVIPASLAAKCHDLFRMALSTAVQPEQADEIAKLKGESGVLRDLLESSLSMIEDILEHNELELNAPNKVLFGQMAKALLGSRA